MGEGDFMAYGVYFYGTFSLALFLVVASGLMTHKKGAGVLVVVGIVTFILVIVLEKEFTIDEGMEETDVVCVTFEDESTVFTVKLEGEDVEDYSTVIRGREILREEYGIEKELKADKPEECS